MHVPMLPKETWSPLHAPMLQNKTCSPPLCTPKRWRIKCAPTCHNAVVLQVMNDPRNQSEMKKLEKYEINEKIEAIWRRQRRWRSNLKKLRWRRLAKEKEGERIRKSAPVQKHRSLMSNSLHSPLNAAEEDVQLPACSTERCRRRRALPACPTKPK